jgi:hypothetical protein
MVSGLKARENKWGNSNPNLKFHQEFEAALKNDQEFEQLQTVERFLFICEELVNKWEMMFHDVNSRKGKKRSIRGRPVRRAKQKQEERSKSRGATGKRHGGRALRWVRQAQPPSKRLSVGKARVKAS